MSYTVLVLGKLYKLERREYRDRASRRQNRATSRKMCQTRTQGVLPVRVSPSRFPPGDSANYTHSPNSRCDSRDASPKCLIAHRPRER